MSEGQREIVLLAAAAACGKSTLTKRFDPNSYYRINQDSLKTLDKCVDVARAVLLGDSGTVANIRKSGEEAQKVGQGKCVVVDNTNLDPQARRRWIDLARELGVKVLYFVETIYS
jgi:bifunctional polynucleotide phosphatase/kinase